VDLSLFSNPKRAFAIALFIDGVALKEKGAQLERLNNQRNVKLIVQPTPFEGIEFLYRIDEPGGNHRSLEKDLFWEAIELKPDTPQETLELIADSQHQRLCAILEQKPETVKKYSALLSQKSEYIISKGS
jgi:hypothetical protein